MKPRRLLAFLLVPLLLVGPVFGTWSIVVIDLETREVAVASATCLENLSLRRLTPVLVPEVGAAVAQCLGDSSGNSRTTMFEQLQLGTPPDEILTMIAQVTRQYGIVDLEGRALTFVHSNCGEWKGGLTGQSGNLVYAIQGNVLTGQAVVDEAELALLQTPGTLSDKLMAAMEAAYAMGGDGRCSCDPNNATGCGAPPPSFTKSAHVGFLLVARPGDPVGICNSNGCARGPIFNEINIKDKNASDPDPVILMRQEFDVWRASLAGRPDAYRSTQWISAERVPAGSTGIVTLVADLADIDGNLLTAGGATVTLQHDPKSAGQASLQSVIDHGDGTYTLEILPGPNPGRDLLRVIVDDGVQPVTLWPPVALLHEPLAAAPANDFAPVAGLDPGAPYRNAQLLPDGLTAYFLALDAQGFWQLLRAERASTAMPFGSSVPQPIDKLAQYRISDFVLSADELSLIAAAFGPGSSVSQLFETRRASVSDPFPEPTLIADLDSGAGEGGPALSAGECELWFHSSRGGSSDLWVSRRLSPDARWFPPRAITELDGGGDETEPLLVENDTRLVFSRSTPEGGLVTADLRPDGSFDPPVALAGGVAPPGGALASSFDAANQALWISHIAGAGTEVAAGTLTPAALQASQGTLSAAAGGTVDLDLDAGPAWDSAQYLVLGSTTVAGSPIQQADAVLPFVFDDVTARIVAHTNDPIFADFFGTLDSNGRATAALQLAAGLITDPALLNRSYRFAFLALAGGQGFASNAVTVELLP